jgi:hypothetical protein
MPEPKRLLKVFLCHAHADRDTVRALYTRLTRDGVDAWFDKEKLLPGQDWELEIKKVVRDVDVVVVCLSRQFNQAGFRQKEVRLALDTAMEKPEGEIFIIPARLEECEMLESLKKWHRVDLFEDRGYEALLRALQIRAEKIRGQQSRKEVLAQKDEALYNHLLTYETNELYKIYKYMTIGQKKSSQMKREVLAEKIIGILKNNASAREAIIQYAKDFNKPNLLNYIL